MSEHHADPVSGNNPNAAAAAPAPDAAESAAQVDSPTIAPQASPADEPAVAAVPVSEPVAPAVESAKADTPRAPGKIMIMAPSPGDWSHRDHDDGAAPSSAGEVPQTGVLGKRRLSALAAMVALAALAGAVGGSLATAGIGHFRVADQVKPAAEPSHAVEASIQRIDSELAALKSGVEHSSRQSASQLGKTNDRIDKVEKAQIEPAAKLAKLTEAFDKLRIAAATPAPSPPAPAPTPAPLKETTASIAAAAPVPVPAPKPEIARLPIVETWSLRDVADGAALIQGRQGIYEVYTGDVIPGLGRVDAIRRQDGRWTVVTSKGLIVAR